MARVTIFLLLVAACDVYSQRSGVDIIRKALRQDPMMSHLREPKWVPQNINIVQAVDSGTSIALPAENPSLAVVPTHQRRPPSFSNNGIQAGRPATTWRPLAVRRQDTTPPPETILNMKPIINDFSDINKAVDPAFKRLGGLPPTPHNKATKSELIPTAPKPVQPITSQGVFSTATSDVCDFNIPSFLLPDPSIDQVQFDQTLMMPAIRAFVSGAPCRTRTLNIYLDWLLHLRQKLFNV